MTDVARNVKLPQGAASSSTSVLRACGHVHGHGHGHRSTTARGQRHGQHHAAASSSSSLSVASSSSSPVVPARASTSTSSSAPVTGIEATQSHAAEGPITPQPWTWDILHQFPEEDMPSSHAPHAPQHVAPAAATSHATVAAPVVEPVAEPVPEPVAEPVAAIVTEAAAETETETETESMLPKTFSPCGAMDVAAASRMVRDAEKMCKLIGAGKYTVAQAKRLRMDVEAQIRSANYVQQLLQNMLQVAKVAQQQGTQEDFEALQRHTTTAPYHMYFELGKFTAESASSADVER